MITNIPSVLAMRTVLVRVGAAVAVVVLGALVLGACGDDGDPSGGDGSRVVVTTSILGDVVERLVGDAVDVEVLMPPGQDPHDLAPSPRQVATMRDADVLVVNGAGFEVALADAIDAAAADGVRVVAAIDGVDTLPLPDGGADDVDPHFFTDPARMRAAAAHLAGALVEALPELDTPAVDARVADYLDELAALDREVASAVAAIPAERRLLVTNHEVLGYFADRYGFEVVGAIIPGGSTLAEPGAGDLDELSRQIESAGVPAIFAETSAPARLAEALAAEGAAVTVVELYSESLGEPGSGAASYVEMVRTNVQRIVAALR